MKICLIYWDIISEKLKTVVFDDKHLHNIAGYLLSKKNWNKDKNLLALWEVHLQTQYGENFLKGLVSNKRSKMINKIITTNSPDRSYILQVAKTIRAKILKFEPIRDNWQSIYKEKLDINKIKLFD
jgi:F0F1-type ATP synthase delta subunit